VRPRAILQAVAAGGGVAVLAAWLNGVLLERNVLDLESVSRFAAPVVEELLKAAWVIFLIRGGKVGFLVDAAILGFAVGTGFALAENIEYLRHLEAASLSLWAARGLGTAILHGVSTSILAVLAKALHDQRPGFAAFLPGVLAAILLHAAFNQVALPPLLSALVMLAVLPLPLVFAFERSERATRAWLSSEFDGELQMLQDIFSGRITHTRTGAYLESLKSRFEGTVVVDMLCLLRVQLELKIRAKGVLMAREAGIEIKVGDDVRSNLRELRYLKGQIGRTGLLAMRPILSLNARDVWQLSMMEE
jgi:hypothetical protein